MYRPRTYGRTSSEVLSGDIYGDRHECTYGNLRLSVTRETAVIEGIQGRFLLSDTLYRDCDYIGGLIHISQYMLPMCTYFFWSLLHYSPKYAVCSSVSLFLKFTDE